MEPQRCSRIQGDHHRFTLEVKSSFCFWSVVSVAMATITSRTSLFPAREPALRHAGVVQGVLSKGAEKAFSHRREQFNEVSHLHAPSDVPVGRALCWLCSTSPSPAAAFRDPCGDAAGSVSR